MERHKFDPNQPQGTMSLQNMRNTLRGLFQGDLLPLRPLASKILDDMEYSTDPLAAAVWAGTGCTVTKDTAVKHDGNAALKIVVDGTGNRQCDRTHSLVLTGYLQIKWWDYCDDAAQTYKFLIRDASGNESYWDLTTHASATTWKQQTITLASPDSNNGTNASLATIVKWGFKALPASKTFQLDNVEAVCGMQIAVEPALVAAYYSPVYIGTTHISYAGGSSPVMVAPSANPRLSLLTIDTSGVLAWTDGAENSSPVEPTYPTGKMPIALVYCKTTMTKIVNFEDAAANPNEGYIYRDVRPLFLLGMASFLALTDCPSSYTSQALKHVRVNSGATGLEFVALTMALLTDLNLVSLADGEVLRYNSSTGKWENKKRHAVYK